MSKIQFAYNVFGQENIDSGKIYQNVIDSYYNDWKSTNLSFNVWFSLLKTRG